MNTVVDKNTSNSIAEVINTTQIQLLNESIDNEELIEAISDLIDLYIVCIKLECLDERLLVEKILYLTNKWIELIGSTKYIPGLVEELSKNIVKKLWDSDVDYQLLNELLLETYSLRRRADVSRESIEKYRELVLEFLDKLGYGRNSELINSIVETSDPENLITLFVLSLVISTSVEYSYLL